MHPYYRPYKPELDFWQHILAEEGVSAQRTFFTDDEDNIKAASSPEFAVRYIDADHLRRALLYLTHLSMRFHLELSRIPY